MMEQDFLNNFMGDGDETTKSRLKQLKWEAQRDDWIHGRDAKTLRKKKTMFNKKKTMFGRPRTTGKTFGNKKKKK